MKALNLISGAQNATAKTRERAKELPTIGDVWETSQRKKKPTHFHDCTGTTSGVGKITVPQRID
jgi:hypothetical protein